MSQNNKEIIDFLNLMFNKAEVELERQCQHYGCNRQGLVYDYSISQDGHSSDITIFCNKHARDAGFCFMCHQFWGMDDSLMSDPEGMCSICRADIEEEDWADYSDDRVDIDEKIV